MKHELETEDDYREALGRFLDICSVPKNEEEIKEMHLLMELLEKYERENCSYN